MNAKEIADLARSTNLTDEDAVDAFVDTLSARVAARRNTGENVDMERALREAASVAREAAVRLGKALDVCAHETARVAALTRSESGKVNRWDLEHLSAPQHDAGLYSAAFAAWESMVDLFESVADLVRGTDAEKAEALAKRAADKAAIVAVAPKAKSRKKS